MMMNLTEGYKFKLHTLVVTCFFTLSDNLTIPERLLDQHGDVDNIKLDRTIIIIVVIYCVAIL